MSKDITPKQKNFLLGIVDLNPKHKYLKTISSRIPKMSKSEAYFQIGFCIDRPDIIVKKSALLDVVGQTSTVYYQSKTLVRKLKENNRDDITKICCDEYEISPDLELEKLKVIYDCLQKGWKNL